MSVDLSRTWGQAAPMSRLLRSERLMGVDVARGIALIAMMSVHIIPSVTADGSVSWAYRISSGRASALFSVLAGLSLVLASGSAGGQHVQRGARRGVLGRAAVIAMVGLFLGAVGSGVAVILVHYAVLFLIGTIFMGFRCRVLMVTAAGWMLLTPVVGHLLRPYLPPGPGPSPSVASLANPVQLVTTVLFTGYYPVLQWTGYLLVGMALARLPLRRRETALWLLTGGAMLAAGSKLLSSVLLGPAGGFERLTVPPSSVLAGRDLATVLETGTYGTTPSSSWWWLAVSAPHSGAPLDLLHTTGTAVSVIGACLLAISALRGRGKWLALPVAAAGSMTLTLYTLHVIALAAVRGAVGQADVPFPVELWVLNALVAILLATAWQFTGRRGPLEDVAADMSRAARHSATPLAQPAPGDQRKGA